MSINLNNDLSPRQVSTLLRLSSKSVKASVIIAAMTAMTNAIWVTYHLVELDSRLGRTSRVIVQIDPSVSLMHIRIALALLLAAVCLWHRRVASLLMSVGALIWVLVEYGRWYLWSLSIQRETGAVGSGLPQVFGLYGGNIWNVAVIVIALGLVIWEVKILFGSLRPLPPLGHQN